MNQELIALAEMIDNARIAANANDATAPQSGVYGDLQKALQSTLELIAPKKGNEIYTSIMENGNSVRDAIHDVTAVRYSPEESDEISEMLKAKFTSTRYSIVAWQLNFSDVWECQTFDASSGGYVPEATFRVRVIKNMYGWATQAV
jgi:hypothetical protein